MKEQNNRASKIAFVALTMLVVLMLSIGYSAGAQGEIDDVPSSNLPPPIPESDLKSTPLSITADTIFSDSFSGAHPGAWTIGHDGGGGIYAWAWPYDYAHEYSDPIGGSYFYPDDLHVFMELRGVSLVGYSTATLSFYRIVDTETNYDELTVNVRDQSGAWHYIDGWSGITDPLDWTYTELNLDQFAGQSDLTIQFRFDSDSSISGDPYDGAYIDVVTISADYGLPDIRVDPTSLSFTRDSGAGVSASVVTVNIPDEVREANHTALYAALDSSDFVPAIVELEVPMSASDLLVEQEIKVAAAQTAVLNQLSAEEFVLKRTFSLSPGFSGWVSRSGLDALLAMPEVSMVYENIQVSHELSESVPLINADQVHNQLGITGNGVGVAVLDTGIDTNHTDLSDDLLDEHCFTAGACPPSNTNEGSSAEDGHGHGTSVSGIVTSRGTVAPLGVAPDAGVVAVKVLADSGSGWLDDWVEGINWVTTNHSHDTSVINLSLGTYALHSGECDANYPSAAAAVNTAVSNGISVFAASGNDASDSQMSAPACLSNVISVGAVYDANVGPVSFSVCSDSSTDADQVACFSNSSALLDLLAPSYRNRTTAVGGGTTSSFGGTSAATPHAAATAALMLEASPGQTPTQISDTLAASGVQITDPRNGLSRPRIDAYAAIQDGGLTIYNDGGAPLQIQEIAKLSGGCWLTVTPPQSTPFSIGAGEHVVVGVDVDISCVGIGFFNDTIRISSNDPDEPQVDVPVTLEVLGQPHPDLVVSEPSPASLPPFTEGQSVDWSVISTNQGDAASAAADVGYYLGTSCEDLSNRVKSVPVEALNPGESESTSDAYVFVSADVGSRYLIAWIDYEGLVNEGSNEDNNTSCYGPFTVEDQSCHVLNTSVNPAGSGSIDASPPPNCNNGTQYLDGTEVTLTAVESNPDYRFGSWSGDIGGANSTANPISVTMNQDRNITANLTLVDLALLSVVPADAVMPVNGESTVDIVASSITGLYGAQMELHFDPEFVEVVDAQVTPGTCPAPDIIAQNIVDNVNGIINYGVTSITPSVPCDGGVVMSITFRGLSSGVSSLDFASWLLSDFGGLEKPAEVQNGTLTILNQSTIEGKVLLQGRGDFSGANVCADDGGGAVCVQTGADGSYSIGVAAGIYSVTVDMERYLDAQKLNVPAAAGAATLLPDVTCLGGDSNDDCTINILDLALMGGRFNLSCGDPSWDSKADINDDCTVNILDLAMAGGNFNEACPVPWAP